MQFGHTFFLLEVGIRRGECSIMGDNHVKKAFTDIPTCVPCKTILSSDAYELFGPAFPNVYLMKTSSFTILSD